MNVQHYILDLLIKKGEILLEEPISSPMWFIISCDGLAHPFSTNTVNASYKPEWNFPTRLILKIQDISRAYLYFTLCGYGANGRDVVALARSRVGLRSFPKGHPKQIRFPLMNASNSAQVAMNLNMTATLSVLSTQPYSNNPNNPNDNADINVDPGLRFNSTF